MSDLIWLTEIQMKRISPYFPLSHGIARVDDRRSYGDSALNYPNYSPSALHYLPL